MILKSICIQLTPSEVARRRKILRVHSCIHQNHVLRLLVCTRTAHKNAPGYVCFAAVYFAFSFVVVKPIQFKQVEVSLASYLYTSYKVILFFYVLYT